MLYHILFIICHCPLTVYSTSPGTRYSSPLSCHTHPDNFPPTYCLPTSLVLYTTIDSDVALAYLPTVMVTSTMVDMIMSLVTFTKIRN